MMAQPPDARPDLEHVCEWVFDLDNTLYPPSCQLFTQMDARMRGFITGLLGVDADEAYRLQKQYFRDHGTTLSGLMALHNVPPKDFLDHVHDLDVTVIPEDPALAAALVRLPGRKLVFTNGTVAHAERVLARLGITHVFDDIFDIVHADYHPKPSAASFSRFIARHGVDPASAAMFEDLSRNLAPAHALGMTTVLVRPQDGHGDPAVRHWGEPGPEADHVHYHTEDLAGFLSTIRVRSIL
jgi:putative hydrolase of the HAD superfamily